MLISDWKPVPIISAALAPAALYKLWYLHHVDWVWYIVIYTLACSVLILRKTSCSALLLNAILSILIAPVSLAWWVVIWVPWLSGIIRHVLTTLPINALMVAWALVFSFIHPQMLVSSSATMMQVDWQAMTWQEFSSLNRLQFGSTMHNLMLCALILIAGLSITRFKRDYISISISFLTAFILFHLLLYLQFSDNQYQIGSPGFYLFNSGALLAGFFILTDPKSAPLSQPSQVASGIIAASILVYCHHTLPTPDSIVVTIILTNLIMLLGTEKIAQWWYRISQLIRRNNAVK